jgi:hypothetical protein
MAEAAAGNHRHAKTVGSSTRRTKEKDKFRMVELRFTF